MGKNIFFGHFDMHGDLYFYPAKNTYQERDSQPQSDCNSFLFIMIIMLHNLKKSSIDDKDFVVIVIVSSLLLKKIGQWMIKTE